MKNQKIFLPILLCLLLFQTCSASQAGLATQAVTFLSRNPIALGTTVFLGVTLPTFFAAWVIPTIEKSKKEDAEIKKAFGEYTQLGNILQTPFEEKLDKKIDQLINLTITVPRYGENKTDEAFPTINSKKFVCKHIADFFDLSEEELNKSKALIDDYCIETEIKLNLKLQNKKIELATYLKKADEASPSERSQFTEKVKLIQDELAKDQAIDSERQRYMNQFNISPENLSTPKTVSEKAMIDEWLDTTIGQVTKTMQDIIRNYRQKITGGFSGYTQASMMMANSSFRALFSLLTYLCFKKSKTSRPISLTNELEAYQRENERVAKLSEEFHHPLITLREARKRQDAEKLREYETIAKESVDSFKPFPNQKPAPISIPAQQDIWSKITAWLSQFWKSIKN